MHFLPDNIDEYAVKHSQEEPKLLQELTRETWQKVLAPVMLSGHYQGRVLSMISKLVNPLNILEIGTYTGYSALCLAEGMQQEGTLHTIDINEELHDFQRKYFDKSDFSKQIIQHTGNALDIIPKLEKKFDIVFLDADKGNYPKYIETVLPKMNKGGVLLSDNVLWYGKVAQPTKEKDLDTIALKEYNTIIHEHPQLESVLLPIRDGLTISRKI
ncbi:O-methyltransferase [unidentified eubacterium SCB49]|nr:O-methyltransferase [unidentified eubacterium SCB49]